MPRRTVSTIPSSQRGVGLLELLVASVIAVFGFLMVALLIPRASSLAFNNRMRWQASELARQQIEQYKTASYGLIPLTPRTTPPFAVITNPAGPPYGCDCKATDTNFSAITPTAVIASSVTYTLRTCVNYVDLTGGTWVSKCDVIPGTLDTNTKFVRVQVSWTDPGNNLYSTENEILINR